MRPTSRATAGVLLAVGLAAPSVTYAQTDPTPVELADGQYDGVLSFAGGFILDPALMIAESGQSTSGAEISGSMTFDSNLRGPASMIVAGNEVSGEWALAGTSTFFGTMIAEFGGVSSSLLLDGSGTYDGTGTFEGTSSAAVMVGTLDSTGTGTVYANGGEASSSTTDSVDLSLTLTEPVADCGRAFARVDLEIRQQIDQLPGATTTLIGVFSAGQDNEGFVISEYEIINDDVSALWNSLATGTDPYVLVDEAFTLLRRIEELEDAFAEANCGDNPDFANAMTLLGAQLVRAVLNLADSGEFSAGERLVLIELALEMGLRTGALGAGRGDRDGARQIGERARDMVGEIFNEATQSGDVAAVRNAAVLGRQYGWEFTADGGLTSQDAIDGIGE